MSRLLCLVLAGTLSSAYVVGAEAPPGDVGAPCLHPLLDKPDGVAVGCLEEQTPIRIREHLPGWVRVQVEGWMPEARAASLAVPSGRAALSISTAVADGRPAAGVSVRLLARPEEVDTELASLRQRYSASRLRIDERLQEVDRALERVLFSTDNLMQAQEQRRILRQQRQTLEQERASLRLKTLDETVTILERRKVGAATGDASGFCQLEGIEPGPYSLLVMAGRPGEAPAWYIPLSLAPGERRRLDLTTLQPRQDPFAGLD